MAFLEIGSDGTLNGTADVTIIAAPAASTRRLVKTIIVHNRDTVSHGIVLKYVNGGSERWIIKSTLGAGETLVYDNVLVLDTTSKSIEAVQTEATTTTNPDYVCTYGDAS